MRSLRAHCVLADAISSPPTDLYQSVAIHLKYVLLVILHLPKCFVFDHAPKRSFAWIFETPYLNNCRLIQVKLALLFQLLPRQALEYRRQP